MQPDLREGQTLPSDASATSPAVVLDLDRLSPAGSEYSRFLQLNIHQSAIEVDQAKFVS